MCNAVDYRITSDSCTIVLPFMKHKTKHKCMHMSGQWDDVPHYSYIQLEVFAACIHERFLQLPRRVHTEVSPDCDGYSAAVSCCRAGQVSARLQYVG